MGGIVDMGGMGGKRGMEGKRYLGGVGGLRGMGGTEVPPDDLRLLLLTDIELEGLKKKPI